MRRPAISPSTYRVVTAVATAALAAIIVTGAGVRLTGSGMGCPTWPTCDAGSLVPRAESSGHAWIEFGNRTITGLVSVAVILAVLGALWRVPYRRDLAWWAGGLVAGVLAQALLGGIVVWLHVAPVAVMGHYLLSAVLIWNAVVLHHKAGEPADAARTGDDGVPTQGAGRAEPRSATPGLLGLSRATVAAAVVVLVTGTVVTGAGPHGGDEEADRLEVAVSSAARVHGAAVWTFLALTLVALWVGHRGGATTEAMARARLVAAAIAVQGAIGYVQYANDVPELLVGAHVLGSVLVWIAVLRFHLALASPPRPRDRGATAPARPLAPAVVP